MIMALHGFGNRLKSVRQDRGYTQKQLAGLLGVTEQAVSKWERESSYPDISMLNGISEVMDCSLDYLFQYQSGKKNLLAQDSIELRDEINRYLLSDIISLEFGESLISLFMEEGRQGYPHINDLRCQIAEQWGIIIPAIRIMDELTLEPNQYNININGRCVYDGKQDDVNEDGLIFILDRLKEMILKNIESVLNNQTVYYLIENLRRHYPYVVENIVPDVISYSTIRQVLIHLIKDYGCPAKPLILIIETMEFYVGKSDGRELAEKVYKYLVEVGSVR